VALAQRQRLESGVFAGSWFALIGHLSIVCMVLAAPNRPSPVLWKVVPVVPLPAGERLGSITPDHDGGSAAKPPLVRRPGSPARAARFPLPATTAPEADPAAPSGRGYGDPEADTHPSPAITIGDPLGDTSPQSWYLATVRYRIWSIWTAETRADARGTPEVEFTILTDGSLGSVELTQGSGDSHLDRAAQRAVWAAGPFAPIPKESGRDSMRVRAVFRPSS
jgi:TonB family protein